ncbi:MAG: translation initiation factor IF-2 [Bacteroidales bacterium]|nr:translation initiation factor IF-2 [Bacteroidales bacterium]
MSEDTNKTIRLSKAAKEFNVGMGTILDFLAKKGFQVDSSPNTKLSAEMYALLVKEYQGEREVKNEAKKLGDLSYKGGSVSVDSTIQTPATDNEEDDAEVFIRSTTISPQTRPETKVEEKVETKAPEKTSAEPAQTVSQPQEEKKADESETGSLKVVGKIDLDSLNAKTRPEKKSKAEKQAEAKKAEAKKAEPKKAETKKPEAKKPEEKKQEPAPVEPKFIKTEVKKLEGPKILDKIELPEERKRSKQQPVASSEGSGDAKKKKRKRIAGKPENAGGKVQPEQQGKKNPKKDKGKPQPRHEEKVELSDEEISKQIKDTLARLSPLGKSKTSKHRREKRQHVAGSMMEEQMRQQEEQSVLKLTEFVTANDLAVMMGVPVTKVIATCMGLGMPVSINQRLDAEALSVVASEFGFQVDFVSADVQEAIAETEEEDREEDLVPRAPVVTVMGHVDHGKTKLLDYIRNTNVVAGEAGGITQHIGAYEVTTASGKKITFLDTPGHEAFTAMRARGAKMTDVAIIVIATDDNVMPQTVEAINHAQAAGVPIVFALNKIDKPTANPDKIREQLSKMNILVESWGGKYQEQEIAAKTGLNVEELLEKVLLEAEFLDLKANPNKLAKGTVIESALDKGRGYVAKILVQSGTLRVGDMVLAGTTFGKVKAMFNDHNQKIKEAGPSTPVLLLGLNGAPQPGDTFNVMTDEREVKDIANRREQLQREQTRRTNPHITLDEIGRRIAIGDFKELNIIVKADVDGSVEALSDSLLKLSTEEVQVNVIHKSVGAISESDIMLASASNAVIVGFNVRPTVQARKLADQEKIDIRIYSIIYQAIEEIKAAIEGMLAPEIEEVVTCNLEIRETFKISKVGTIAGCMVLDGKITRNTKIRIIRDGIVIYTGTLGSLKRFKDDVKEVPAGMDCGLNIENFNDIKVGDIIEGYTEKEIARKL